MKLGFIAILILGLAACIAASQYSQLEKKEFVVPSGWSLIGRSSPTNTIKLQIAITQENLEQLTVRSRIRV